MSHIRHFISNCLQFFGIIFIALLLQMVIIDDFSTLAVLLQSGNATASTQNSN